MNLIKYKPLIICGDNLKEELNKLLENTEYRVIGCGDGIIEKIEYILYLLKKKINILNAI